MLSGHACGSAVVGAVPEGTQIDSFIFKVNKVMLKIARRKHSINQIRKQAQRDE